MIFCYLQGAVLQDLRSKCMMLPLLLLLALAPQASRSLTHAQITHTQGYYLFLEVSMNILQLSSHSFVHSILEHKGPYSDIFMGLAIIIRALMLLKLEHINYKRNYTVSFTSAL